MNKKILIIPAALLITAGLTSCNKGPDTEGHLVTYNVADGVCVSSLSNANRDEITNITVPNSIGGKPVVEISKGAFKACPNLKSISLPFIGHKANSDGIGGLFGYVFGDEMYDGGGAFTWQCYGLGNRYDDGVTDYHEFAIPTSLHSVTITGGDYISAGAFSKCKTIRDITITDDNKATEIGNYAFYDCTSLKSFTIPSKIKTIGRKAFQRCYNLQEIVIPEGVTTVRHNAFSKCISAAKAVIPTTVDNMGKLVFEDFVSGLIMTPLKEDKPGWDPDWANSTASIVYDYHNESLVMINDAQFAICGEGNNRYFFLVQYVGTWESEKITIPGSLTVNGMTLPLKKIGPSVFLENTHMKELEIQEGVELIGAHAFATCTNLVKVTFPESLKEIGAYAFYDCRKLGTNTQITLPKVEKIGVGSFMGCYSEETGAKYGLTRIDLGNSLVEIGDSAFEGDELLMDSVDTSIPDPESPVPDTYDFIIPKSVKKIGTKAFFKTFKTAIPDVTGNPTITFEHDENMPCNLEEVGESAFEALGVSDKTKEDYPEYKNYSSIQIDIDLGSLKLEKIPNRMFYITHIGAIKNFPDKTLKEVGEYAFYYTYGRSGSVQIKLGSNLKTLDKYAFCNCYRYEFNFLNNPVEENGDEFNIETIGDYAFSSCYYVNNKALQIPSTVKTMGAYAFNNCYSLKDIRFPTEGCQIERLEAAVFASCSGLGKDASSYTFNLPATITYVGGSAFSGCSYLTSIIFNNTDDCITTVGSSAFSGCTKLTEVKYTLKGGTTTPLSNCTSFSSSVYNNCKALTNPVIPTNYTSIASKTFFGCESLESFNISGAVTTINANAFNGCTALTEITGADGVITIGSNAFSGCTALATFNIPTTVSTIADNAFAGCTSLGKDSGNEDVKFILPAGITVSWTGSKGMGATPFAGWGGNQTIYFRDDNLSETYDEQKTITTRWGWTLERYGTSGAYYYITENEKESGSSSVKFVHYTSESI